jgi:hypothetical protein
MTSRIKPGTLCITRADADDPLASQIKDRIVTTVRLTGCGDWFIEPIFSVVIPLEFAVQLASGGIYVPGSTVPIQTLPAEYLIPLHDPDQDLTDETAEVASRALDLESIPQQ